METVLASINVKFFLFSVYFFGVILLLVILLFVFLLHFSFNHCCTSAYVLFQQFHFIQLYLNLINFVFLNNYAVSYVSPDNTFGQRLLYMCTQGLFECLALNLYCLRGEQRALTTVINHRIVRFIDSSSWGLFGVALNASFDTFMIYSSLRGECQLKWTPVWWTGWPVWCPWGCMWF